MNLECIEAFLTIVSTKSITKTAERLFLSQPTVSNRLKALEQELNVPLIIRQKGIRDIELTYQGERFLPIAEQWLSLYKDTKDIQNLTPHMYLSVGCPDTLLSYFLPPLFIRMLALDTPVQLKVTAYHSEELHKALEERKIDVALGFYPIDSRNVIQHTVFHENFYLVRPSPDTGTEPAKCMDIHPTQLDRRDEIAFYWYPKFQQWHDKWWDPEIRPIVEIDTASLLSLLMVDKKRWAIMPYCVVNTLQNDRNFQICKLLENPPSRDCYLFTHKYPKPHHIQCINTFKDNLAKFCDEQTWNLFE